MHNPEITNIKWERVGIGNYEHEELRGRDHYGHTHVLESRGGDMGIYVHSDFDKNFHQQSEVYHLENDASRYVYTYNQGKGEWCIEDPDDRIFVDDYYKE
jgi:hypothetical protein